MWTWWRALSACKPVEHDLDDELVCPAVGSEAEPVPSCHGSPGKGLPPALPIAWADHYELVAEDPIIGQGSFATVFQVRYRSTMQHLACKVLDRNFMEAHSMGPQILTEIRAMELAGNSPNVVKLIGVAEEGGFIFLLLELCHLGSLSHELESQRGGCIPEVRVQHYTRQLLQGLQDLHSAGIMHRDIKPNNLLVALDGSLKLADFGWAAFVKDGRSDIAGSFPIMAPEVLTGQVQTTAIDIWSAGTVLFYLVTGRPLLDVDVSEGTESLPRLLAEIQRSCPLKPSEKPPHVSEGCWDLLSQMLVPTAALRATAQEALQHRWLASSFDNDAWSDQKVEGSTPPTTSPASSPRSLGFSPTASELRDRLISL